MRHHLLLAPAYAALALGLPSAGGAATASCEHPVFETRETFRTSINQNSRYLRFGDMDGDGDVDAVTGQQGVADPFCNCYPGEVAVLFNDGGGLFSEPLTYEETDFLNGLELGDLDGDGDLEVVVGNTRDNALWIYFNDGDGNLSLQGVYSLSRPSGIGIGDYSGDGAPDLLVSYSLEVPNTLPRIRVYLNDGTGGFALESDFENSLRGPARPADVDGDGKLDAVVLGTGSAEVGVLFGQGDGTFLIGPRVAVDPYPKDVAFGDLDGNGTLDMVTANFESSSVSILLGRGDGTFEPALNRAVGDLPLSVDVGDLDGDGDLDVVTGDSGGGLPGFDASLSVLLNDGAGDFSTAARHDSGSQPGSLKLADLDGDGDLDTGSVAREGRGAFSVVPGNGDGTLGPKGPEQVGVGGSEVLVGDLDGDGRDEFVVLNANDGDASVFRNSGEGDPIDRVDYPVTVTLGPRRGALADLDGDSELDLVVADFILDAIALLPGGGDGSFGESLSFPAGTRPFGLAAADFDGDELIDVATANRDGDDVTVLRNLGGGSFAAPVAWPVGPGPEELVAGDLNGDGDPDLVAANVDFGFGDTISILRSTGDGEFAPQESIRVGEGPRGLALGDPDGDGDLDLAVASSGSNSVSLLLNRGDGTFSAPTSIAALYDAATAVWHDVSSDGHDDLLVAAAEDEFGIRRLAVLFSRSDGSLETPFFYRTDWEPGRFAVVDADRDGAPDVAVLETIDFLSVVMGSCIDDAVFADGFESGDLSAWSGSSPPERP